MPRRKSRTLTEVELEFMQVIWGADELTTEDVQNALRKQRRELSDGSIRKVLSILIRKGYLSRRQVGRGFRYRATVAEVLAHRSMIKDLLQRAFGGSAALMVARLLESSAVPKEELREIKRLIAKQEREDRK